MEFTPKTKLVLEKLVRQTREGKYKWIGRGDNVRRVYNGWEIILKYSESKAVMTFEQCTPISNYTFNYVANTGSKQYDEIQEIVDIALEPIVAILDALLMDTKRELGTLTIMDRIRNWWRKN